jgi:hypothetical protein
MTPERGFEVRPELLEQFPEQFAAAFALYDFAAANRPAGPPSDDVIGRLILWTYARSTKSFNASLRLSAAGFGEQGGMINRSMFEDVMLAHWAKKHPPEVVKELIDEHEAFVRERWRRNVAKHDLPWMDGAAPLTDAEWRRLSGKFRPGTWAARRLYDVVKDVEDLWVAEVDRRLLWQQHDLVNSHNIALDHQTTIGLRLAGQLTDGRVAFQIGPSDVQVFGALAGAFWDYANMVSLVVAGDLERQLNELYSTHIAAFTQRKESGDPAGRPAES